VFSLLAALLTFFGAGEPLETSVGLRQLYKLRGAETPPPNALIIAVNEASVSRINASASTIQRADPDGPPTPAEVAASDFAKELPGLANCMPTADIEKLAIMRNKNLIPRSLHACLLPILNAQNPSVIFFDILFEERSDRLGDQLLADAFAATPNALILKEIKRDADLGVMLQRFPTPAIREAVGEDRLVFFVVDNLADSTRYVERFADIPAARNAPNVALDLHLGQPPSPPPPLPAPGIDLLNEFWLYGPPGAIPIVTLADIFADRAAVPLPDLSDKAVFIGAWEKNTQNAEDSFATPLSDDRVGDHFGIELAATAFLNKLTGQHLIRPTYAVRAAIVGALAFLMLALGRLLTGYRGMVAIAAAGALWLALAWLALESRQLWLPLAVPIFIIAPLAAILSIGANYARVRDVVQRLAPLPIARLLIAQRDRGPMKMREEVGTVLFADLTG
jgi:CHASE2 domain-containing sensor protein